MFKVALCAPESTVDLTCMCPPLNLAGLASYLQKNVDDVDVQIFDGLAGEKVQQKLLSYKPNLVGITGTTPQIVDAYALADWARQTFLDSPTVLGGPHASALPDEALNHADFVIAGEGEISFAELVKRLKGGYIEWKSTSEIILGMNTPDLDSLPQPDYDLLRMDVYAGRDYLNKFIPQPTFSVMTSRGCPYRCAFCYNSHRSSKVRYLSATKIVDRLLFLHQKYGVRGIVFQDDEFLVNLGRLRELKKLFEQHGISEWLRWVCQARATSLTSEALDLAESMGCVLVVVGFESFSPRILDYLKSGSLTVPQSLKAIEMFKGRQIKLGCNLIFGTPHESLAEMWESLNVFVDAGHVPFVNLSVLTPNPGTQLWQDCEDMGLLPKPVNYQLLSAQDRAGFNVSSLSPDSFWRFMRDANLVARFAQATRLKHSVVDYLRLARFKGFWYMWLRHPSVMFRLFLQGVGS